MKWRRCASAHRSSVYNAARPLSTNGGVIGETLGARGGISINARVPALLVAAGLFALRVPFIIVIVAAAETAALIRALT